MKKIVATDPFYSEANQTRLKKSIAQLEAGQNNIVINTPNAKNPKAMDEALTIKNLNRSFDAAQATSIPPEEITLIAEEAHLTY